jgi:hypothetical protein
MRGEMDPKQPSMALFVILNKGHIVTKDEIGSMSSPGENKQEGALCDEPVREVVDFSPYEKCTNIAKLLKVETDRIVTFKVSNIF